MMLLFNVIFIERSFLKLISILTPEFTLVAEGTPRFANNMY